MNYIKIVTTRISYRIVGVFCDYDQEEIECMFNEFYEMYQLPKEYFITNAEFKVSAEYSDGAFSGQFEFNVVERIK